MTVALQLIGWCPLCGGDVQSNLVCLACGAKADPREVLRVDPTDVAWEVA